MPDFLSRMAAESHRRVDDARTRVPIDALRDQVADVPRPAALPAGSGFDVIAEVKKRSPSEGMLHAPDRFDVAEMAGIYDAAGAAAISVLTEPAAFAGQLQDLAQVASSVGIPAMRKDFLVDEYQVVEARAHGASGVLLIVRLLDDAAMRAMIDAAAWCGTFLLLEAFDREDLDRAIRLARRAAEQGIQALVGVNSRDLRTLGVEPLRFAELAGHLPSDIPAVAESGLHSKLDVARVAGMGYRFALVGTALMRSPEPGRALSRMLRSARAEVRRQ